MTGVLRSLSQALGFVCLLLSADVAHAEADAKAAPAQPAAHELAPADIEAFLDGLVPLQIETNDIAGAAIAIVKDGKVIFAKGYGVADMKTRAPVSPETTLFRIGSVTKLFTWTAVMQLVEQGKLDLDADVNTYLDFKIPATFGKPLTLRNLMTHRPGFQEVIKGLGARGKPDLAKYVREHTPDQIFEPGAMPAYSNYGAALAGYIVERVSGQPFEAYVEDHIYKPLGMTHSTLRQPLPKDLEPFMSSGYNLASGDPVPFEMVNGHPAGSQASSAADMAKFMIAHLSGGALGDARLLKPETVALMHDTVTTLDPRANGIALGFYEETRNGRRIIGHGGDTIVFHSDLHLIPSENFGFFVSYNSAGRGDTSPRGPLWRKFLDRYFPDPNPPAAKTGTSSAKEVAGTYITSRRAGTSILTGLFALTQITVSARDDGTIEVDALTALNGQPKRWEPTGPLAFREVNGRDKLFFTRDGTGRLTILTWGSGIVAFQKTEFLQSAPFLLGIVGTSITILALNLVLWPFAGFVRWHYGATQDWYFGERLLRLGVMLTSAALLTLIIGFGVVLVPKLDGDPWKLDDSLDATLHLLQYIGIAGAVGALIPVYNAIQSWTNVTRGFYGRVKETAVAVSCIALVWFMWTMNMFDLTLRY